MVSVVVVSAVRVWREAIAAALKSRSDIGIEGQAATSEQAVDLVVARHPAVVVIDAGTPAALLIAERIHRFTPAARLVGVGLGDEEAAILAWAATGMTGYVMRDDGLQELAAAIVAVARDEVACAPRVASTLLRRMRARADEGGFATSVNELTAREQQIVGLLDLGLSNKDIARRLNIEVATVKNHVHHLLQKLHVTSRAEAAARFRYPIAR